MKLKVGDIRDVKVNEPITMKESKTGKKNNMSLNKDAHKALSDYVKLENAQDDEFVFKSRKNGGPLTICAMNKMTKDGV